MKTTCACICLLTLVATTAFAQKYHTPAEILKIMEASKLNYEVSPLGDNDRDTSHHTDLVDHGRFRRTLPDGSAQVVSYGDEYHGNREYIDNLTAAEAAFSADSMEVARNAYMKVLAAAPSQSQVMTFVGQTYDHVHDDSAAAFWYRRAIAANQFDYMAHWFLADFYDRNNEHEKAVREVLTAFVLNRNNPRILTAVGRILGHAGLEYRDWEFRPDYAVKGLGGTKVSVKFPEGRPEWLIYAMCKAAWRFEPGYREQVMSGSNQNPLVAEEIECLAALLTAEENNNQTSDDVAIQEARKALDGKQFTEYVVFETILPGNPGFVFDLTDQFIGAITDYILTHRTAKG